MNALLVLTLLGASFGTQGRQLHVADPRGGLFVLQATFRLENTSWREAPSARTRLQLEPGKPTPVVALAPGTWFVIGQVGAEVFSGVVVTGMNCNDVELGPAPKGKVALCRSAERSASAVFVDDPQPLIERTLPPAALLPPSFQGGVEWERRDATHVDGWMLPMRPSTPRAKFERVKDGWRFIGVAPGE
jgi:hypothetical protein